MQMENKGKYRYWSFDEKKYFFSNDLEQISCTDLGKCRNDCERWLHYKLSQEKKGISNSYLYMGQIFHEVIEQDMRYKVNKGVNMKLNELEPIFESFWNKGKSKVDFTRLEEGKSKLKCRNYIQIYSLKRSSFLYPINQDCIEKFFRIYVKVEGQKIGLTGKMDLLTKDMFIEDHKTASQSWTQEDANSEVQAYIYPFVGKSLGYDIKGFRFSVVTKDNVEVFPVLYDDKKAREWIMYAFQLQRAFHDNNLLSSRSPRICGFCDWKDTCSEVKI